MTTGSCKILPNRKMVTRTFELGFVFAIICIISRAEMPS